MSKLIDKYKKIPVQVKASLWFLICAFLQKGISFITTPIFTRLLSTAEYGKYNVFNSWLHILTVIVTLNLFYGVYTRGLVKYESERNEFSSSLQGLTLTLIVFWTIIYFAFRSFWNGIFNLTTVQMLLMLLIMWTSSVFTFWSTRERVDFKYRKLVIVTLIVSLAKPILGIILVKTSDDKVTARILAIALVELFVYSGFFITQMRRGKRFFDKNYWLHAISFNVPLIPHYLSTVILSSADRIMIERMVGESEAGIYSLAYSISMIMTMFNTALMQTMEPWMFKKINDKKIEDIAKIAYPAFLIVAFVNIALMALAPEAVAIFAPKTYYDAIYVIPPVAMSVFFMFSFTFFAVFEFYYKKTKLISIATSAGAFLNIILNYIFIKLYGYQAAGYTTLFCYIVYAVFHCAFMIKICNSELNGARPYSIKILLGISIVFMGFGFLFLVTYGVPIVRYGIVAVIIILAIIFRRKIVSTIKQLVSLRNAKNNA